MIHQILVGMGCARNVANESAEGMTFESFMARYIEHLKTVSSYDSEAERFDHLDHCHESFSLALRKVSEAVGSVVFSQLPAGKSFARGVLWPDDEPLKTMREREQARLEVMNLRGHFSNFLGARSTSEESSVRTYMPLLRSQNPRHQGGSSKGRGKGSGKGADTSRKRPASELGGEEYFRKPGSQVHTYKWLSDHELFISGLVWNVTALAKRLRVSPVHTKCWPWILSMREIYNRHTLCSQWGKP